MTSRLAASLRTTMPAKCLRTRRLSCFLSQVCLVVSSMWPSLSMVPNIDCSSHSGAFTPGCSVKHLPGYIQNLSAIKEKGVDIVAVIAFNDAWVMSAWGKANGIKGDDIVSTLPSTALIALTLINLLALYDRCRNCIFQEHWLDQGRAYWKIRNCNRPWQSCLC